MDQRNRIFGWQLLHSAFTPRFQEYVHNLLLAKEVCVCDLPLNVFVRLDCLHLVGSLVLPILRDQLRVEDYLYR